MVAAKAPPESSSVSEAASTVELSLFMSHSFSLGGNEAIGFDPTMQHRKTTSAEQEVSISLGALMRLNEAHAIRTQSARSRSAAR